LNASLKDLRAEAASNAVIRDRPVALQLAKLPRKQRVAAIVNKTAPHLASLFVHVPKKPLCAFGANY
jgi:hypothetical protein